MPSLFRRSNAAQYKDDRNGLAGLLRMDSTLLRVVIFLAMSAVFFILLTITSRPIPRGLVPDSTEDTTQSATP